MAGEDGRVSQFLVRGVAPHKANNLPVPLGFIFDHRSRQVNAYGTFS